MQLRSAICEFTGNTEGPNTQVIERPSLLILESIIRKGQCFMLYTVALNLIINNLTLTPSQCALCTVWCAYFKLL